MSTSRTQSGFVILYTVIVSSVVLIVAMAISSIASKELILSATAKDGYKAFYAADAGIECALYNDRELDAFTAGGEIQCFNTGIGPDREDTEEGTTKYYMYFTEEREDAPCVTVTVEKNIDFGSGVRNGTRIESRGYNTCDTGNMRRVERAIQVLYEGEAAPEGEGGGEDEGGLQQG